MKQAIILYITLMTLLILISAWFNGTFNAYYWLKGAQETFAFFAFVITAICLAIGISSEIDKK